MRFPNDVPHQVADVSLAPPRPARWHATIRPLAVERLDERALPSAATITGLGGRIIGSNMVVYGQVQDDQSGADVVTASGGLSGARTTTGAFEFIAPYTGDGQVSLVVRDDEGLDSTTYSISLSPSSQNQKPCIYSSRSPITR